MEDLDLSFEGIFHRYGEPPAEITATFVNGSQVTVLLGTERGVGKVHGILRSARGKVAQTASDIAGLQLPRIAILPQVAPVAKSETVLGPEHVRRNLSTHLASQHFRNQINILHHFYGDFRRIAEETWPGLRIDTFSGHGGNPGDPLRLLVQNEDFVAEVSWMGHGLQMWLQTIWFLARSQSSKIIMLDEPDVYMHPDLQRRLIRYLRNKFSQTIITTHSVEMLSEVGPEEVLIVNRRSKECSFADSIPALQRAIDSLGAVHNVQLTRLWSSRKFLLLEGDDMEMLKRFYDLAEPAALDSMASIPHMSIGGWSGWNYAVGSSMFLENAAGEEILTYCILDSDYHTPQEIAARFRDAEKRGVRLHIWARKEIENYLVIPALIQRVIKEKATTYPSIEEVEAFLAALVEKFKDHVQDAFAESFHLQSRERGLAAANSAARHLLKEAMATPEAALHRISGKKLLSELSSWSKDTYGVSFGIPPLLRLLRREDLAPEVIAVISAIEDISIFPTRHVLGELLPMES